ncbi:MAG: hypothetical protein EHM56_10280 [Chloroflexi bacterium]|nr:MAG: hypothetical protein EHM56_10280 [Chloroflexota bacterium]
MSDEPARAGSEERSPSGRAERMAEAVRLVVTSRERAPRPPRLEHALKRLIWRYNRECGQKAADQEESTHVSR